MNSDYATRFLFLRNPALSYEQLERYYEEARLDTESGFQFLYRAFHENLFLNTGLLIASPDLHKALSEAKPQEMPEKSKLKLHKSLLKYFIRVTTRSTPFGLFSSFSTIPLKGIGHGDPFIELAPYNENRIHGRLDMDILCALINRIELRPEIRKFLRYIPNTSLYKAGPEWRFVEFALHNKWRKYNLTGIAANSILNVLLKDKTNYKSIEEIVSYIVGLGYEPEEASGYVNELIDAGVFVSELYPNVTGEEFQLRSLIKLRELNGLLGNALKDELQILEDSYFNDLEYIRQKHMQLFNTAKALISDASQKSFLQADLNRPIQSAVLPHDLLGQILNATNFMAQYSKVKIGKLDAFKKAFYERYEEREVRLAHALDPDIGIDINAFSDPDEYESDQGRTMRQKILFDSLRKNKREIRLEEYDPAPDSDRMNCSFTFLGSLLKRGNELDIVFMGSNFPNIANLLGRFTHADDVLNEEIKALVKYEDGLLPDDHLVAEIVHLPQGRVGNILAREQLRDYEICFLASTEKSNVIPIEDLYLQMNGDRLILKSKTLGKIIVPRLCTAHNFESNDSLPIYRFLSLMQFEKDQQRFIWWDWKNLSTEPFLPRIRFKNVILSAATWQLGKTNLPEGSLSSDESFISAFKSFQKDNEIPERIVVSEGDNNLIINTLNRIDLLIVKDYLIKYQVITIKESLLDANSLIVHDASGRYANEVAIPFVYNKPKHFVAPKSTPADEIRKHSPGSRWIYYKIYSGPNQLEKILVTKLYPALRQLKKNKVISEWFFVRYGDPHTHLRLRIKARDVSQVGSIIAKMSETLDRYLNNEMVWKTMLDTYQPEVERYGIVKMQLSERIFTVNSRLVIDMKRFIRKHRVDDTFQTAMIIYYVDEFLSSFGLKLPKKIEFAKKMKDNYAREFLISKDSSMKDQWAAKFRLLRPLLFKFSDMERNLQQDARIASYISLVKKSIRLSARVTKKIVEGTPDITSRESLLSSYVHMFVNRFYLKNQRFEELVMYDQYHLFLKSWESIAKKVSNVSG
ncbi:MAG TPA: lantibiotic dehydratase [Chryseosolibacter sp.]